LFTLRRLVICLGILSLALAFLGDGVRAQGQPTGSDSSAVRWQAPEVVFETTDPAISYSTPVGTSDKEGRIHMFWGVVGTSDPSQAAEQPGQILHSMKESSVWQQPIDVISGSQHVARQRVVLDEQGRFQMIWVYGSGYSPEFWSWADSSQASSAQSWLKPKAISHDAAFDGDLVLDANNLLHVVYAVTGAAMISESRGVYHIVKSKETDTWSEPTLVSPAHDNQGIAEVSLTIDQRGCLHTIWEETPLTGYPPAGIYYSRSCDAGQTWEPSVRLQEADRGNPRIVATGDSEVHVVSLGKAGFPGRFHRWSSDGGNTWSEEQVIAPELSGLSGSGLAADSAGVVHLVLIGGDHQQSIWHATWKQGTWSPFENISGSAMPAPGNLFEQVSLEIVNGNRLSVAFQEYGATEQQHQNTRIWFLEGQANAPFVPFTLTNAEDSAPVATAVFTRSPSPVIDATLTPDHVQISQAPSSAPPTQTFMGSPAVVGIISAGILVLLVFLVRILKRR
jgi:hypothetical protein